MTRYMVSYGAERWEPEPPSIRETTGPTRVATTDDSDDFTPLPFLGFAVVHNHGLAEGPGITCPEERTLSGRLAGRRLTSDEEWDAQIDAGNQPSKPVKWGQSVIVTRRQLGMEPEPCSACREAGEGACLPRPITWQDDGDQA